MTYYTILLNSFRSRELKPFSASNNDEESLRSSNETVSTTGLAGKNPYQTGSQHPLTGHLYIPVDHKALPTGAVEYTCKMIQNSGVSNASNATEIRNVVRFSCFK